MEIIILNNADLVTAMAADLVTELLGLHPDTTLGLATGSTQLSLYQRLVSHYKQGLVSFSQVDAFNLDEYFGIAADNQQSYRSYMNRKFFDHIDIDKSRTYLPACRQDENPDAVGEKFEENIQQVGGIDLQVLGLGVNGHIGFNEPGSSLSSRTRIKTLTRQTIKDNSRLFAADEYQPKLAMTMGIATIMDARRILLLATGTSKAAAVKAMAEGPLSASCPASVLQLHRRATILVDAAAAGKLENKDYYQWAYQQNESLKKRFGRPDVS